MYYISIMVVLLFGATALFATSGISLFIFRETIADSMWFIPLLSGVIIGFLFILAVVSRLMPQHPQVEEIRGARRKSKLIRSAIAFAFCVPFMLAATLSTHYVQFIHSEEQWAHVFAEEQYSGKCYTKNWDLSDIHCVGTGFDWPLEKLLLLMSKQGLLNILR